MSYGRFRIAVSKVWTVILCSVSVAVLAMVSSCRSKKVSKTQEPEPQDDDPAELIDEYITTKSGDLIPSVTLPGDSKTVKDMIKESNDLKETLSKRMNSVVYGPPEMMERRAAENREIRHKIDSLDTEIKKARQK